MTVETIDAFEQVFETLPANGWLSRAEAQLLWDTAQITQGPILEVGCYYGRSTVLLSALGRPMYCVDPFDNFDSDLSGDEIEERWRNNLHERDIHNATLFRQTIESWRLRPVGFAYLDGDHTYQGTRNQIAAAINSGARRVCLHDYADSGGGREVKQAIEDSPLTLIQVVERMVRCQYKQ